LKTLDQAFWQLLAINESIQTSKPSWFIISRRGCLLMAVASAKTKMINWREHNIHNPNDGHDSGSDSDGQKEFLFNLFEEETDKALTHDFKSKSGAVDITITLVGREECNTSTGLAVWGGAETLCDYFMEEIDSGRSENLFQKGQSRVLELGAGLGLCGLFVAQAFEPSKVILTDGDVDVLERLEKNIEQNPTSHEIQVSCAQLVWGQNLDVFADEHGKFDVIIASECMYMSPSLQTIWDTVKILLDKNGVFVYVHQASSQVPNEKVLEMATNCGFEWSTSSTFSLVHLFRRKTGYA
jgi:16S rRNA G527 N7-methylase RsmG